MPDGALNADFATLAIMRTSEMEWVESPAAGIWRKRLELAGPAESGRVTSLVRYDPGCAFPAHEHPGGEEILVLDGIFQDDAGDWPAGSYLLNPEGFRHAPGSATGCTLFVKLRQYPGTARRHLALDTAKGEWQAGRTPGLQVLPLYAEDGYPEVMRLVRYAPGTDFPRHDHPGGEEIYVIEGALEDEFGEHGAGAWMRYPAGSVHTPRSAGGCLLYVRTGHLAG